MTPSRPRACRWLLGGQPPPWFPSTESAHRMLIGISDIWILSSAKKNKAWHGRCPRELPCCHAVLQLNQSLPATPPLMAILTQASPRLPALQASISQATALNMRQYPLYDATAASVLSAPAGSQGNCSPIGSAAMAARPSVVINCPCRFTVPLASVHSTLDPCCRET